MIETYFKIQVFKEILYVVVVIIACGYIAYDYFKNWR